MTTTTIRIFKDKENTRFVTDAAVVASGISLFVLNGDTLDTDGMTEEKALAGVPGFILRGLVKMMLDSVGKGTVEEMVAEKGIELLREFEADSDEDFVQLLLAEPDTAE